MRPITIFYLLIVYVVLQFSWWAYLLTELNREVYTHRSEIANLKSADGPVTSPTTAFELEEKMSHRNWMVLGEGMVFLSLLIWGSIITYRSFRRDMELARLQKNFLLSITHEFKSPLASIRLYLETINKHELDKGKQQQFIRNALTDTDRLNTLVENALMASLIEHNGHFFAAERVDLSSLLESTRQIFERVPGHPSLVAEITRDVHVKGDRQALGTLVNNLLENAVKYSPGGAPVSLVLKQEGDWAELRVSDEGIGIPDKEKEQVFRKFYRAGNELTRSTKGTGLGLFLVKYIVEKHQGSVKVSDRHPKGTVFSVRLPLFLS
jgi:signal transduction histidine kinase